MSKWSAEFRPKAEEDFLELDSRVKERVVSKLEWLASSFDSIIPIPLSGEFRGLYKLRVGDWRVVYKADWDTATLVVYYIDHRSMVYKKHQRKF